MKMRFSSLETMKKQVAISGTVDGSSFDWGLPAENPLERRRELVAQLLEGLQNGTIENAPILTDIRSRDGFLRSFYDLVRAGETEKVKALVKGLLVFAQGSTGEVRGMCLTVWAGCAWMLGNSNAIKSISIGEPLEVVKDISLWQLLDIAQRHDVPSAVWESSLAGVSLDACLAGAVD